MFARKAAAGRLVRPFVQTQFRSGISRYDSAAYIGSAALESRHLTSSAPLASPAEFPDASARDKLYPLLVPPSNTFSRRHVGPTSDDVTKMISKLSPPAKSIDDFIAQVVPPEVLMASRELLIKSASADGQKTASLRELDVAANAAAMAARNKTPTSFIGAGYHATTTPAPIARDVLQNPAWYTSYTPYQPEISQGRLQSLLNYQAMVSDLTGLPISNASLLDEGTAAAEAMTLSVNVLPGSRSRRPNKTFVVSDLVHPQTISVLKSRAQGQGINLKIVDLAAETAISDIKALDKDLLGVLVQYPDTKGGVCDFRALSEAVHATGGLVAAATDLLALTVLTPPGEWGADVVFGTAQRFGVPLGNGGPHAAFFAVTEAHKRRMPGRLVGVSRDRLGNRALRLALQTREQHIRREKATSNVCTAQALLANMAAFYAIYHGPQGLKTQAETTIGLARLVQFVADHYGLNSIKNTSDPEGRVFFDTVVLNCGDNAAKVLDTAVEYGCNLRDFGNGQVGISMHDSLGTETLYNLLSALKANASRNSDSTVGDLIAKYSSQYGRFSADSLPPQFKRNSAYLTHATFNSYHSEMEFVRYMHHLQSKDLSLVHSMIPLGSCTMKLNAATEMSLISLPGFSQLHPYAKEDQKEGFKVFVRELEEQLTTITSMDGVSLQPNSGAQGEFAGLRAIHRYHEENGGKKRDICLIPVSAHGTNPASAAMAGMRVVPIKCDTTTGNLDIADLEAKCKKHADELGCIMITYPSTFGIFEPDVRKACDLVHAYGGQVYMDGANMNAQIGLTSPGEIGADVCHLNLHKTFCIPHGGGGPGVGPICVKKHLIPYLPGMSPEAAEPMVSSAPYGSASILPITWSYNHMMGTEGLQRATQVSLLNANYLLSQLSPHYPIVYTNKNGRCAHEFIIDARPFEKTAGIAAIDIAKRLQDYGFHAPTMSWPVPNTLMIEPTESESKEELDRFIEAMISIRGEIRDIEEGHQPREANVMRNAPHPQCDIINGDGDGKWERPYSREKAAYPLPWLREKKFWPSVGRLDDTYGDLNLFCTCPPVVDTTSEAV
ncbi:putative glycine dehydrogenase (decarboxylating), mitochondrial [Ceratocystis fimbriata CBS 114723]|uniref:Glycine cleavage system P protein n=1 Tax=Ceratocystis fimbriata CBS 114723 TaxID=1035309 RepID=A0A2C5X252_9PEZI|nr:putative glycine dehydrogenase (decarboxylating), mitochondrial [Ceratocystis fimbriata CBS 114723]